MSAEGPDSGWAVRHPDGEIEPAGVLGENRARMVASLHGGHVVPPMVARILAALVEARDAADAAGDGHVREGLDEAIEHVHDGIRGGES